MDNSDINEPSIPNDTKPKCPKCNQVLTVNNISGTCIYCGAQIETKPKCPNCNQVIVVNNIYDTCFYCGAKLPEELCPSDYEKEKTPQQQMGSEQEEEYSELFKQCIKCGTLNRLGTDCCITCGKPFVVEISREQPGGKERLKRLSTDNSFRTRFSRSSIAFLIVTFLFLIVPVGLLIFNYLELLKPYDDSSTYVEVLWTISALGFIATSRYIFIGILHRIEIWFDWAMKSDD